MHTGVVIQHRIGDNSRVRESRLRSTMVHVGTAHPPRSIRLLVLPVIPGRGMSIGTPCSSTPIIPIRSRHVSVICYSTPPTDTPTHRSPVLMLLIPLGEVSLAVSVLTTTIRRALVVRLIILLQKEVTWTLYSKGYYKHSSCPNSLFDDVLYLHTLR